MTMNDTLAEPMTSSEAVLWTIERDPVLRSTIVVVAVLDSPPDLERLQERLGLAAEAFPRLHQRVEPSRAGVPHWVDAEGVDLAHHLHHVALPAPGSMRQLLDLAGDMAGEAFDPARPLWEMTVVEGLEGGCAGLVIKLHHTVTDGVGGVSLMPIFTDSCPEPIGPPDLTANRKKRDGRTGPAGPVAMFSGAATAFGSAITHPQATISATPKVVRSIGKLLAPATHALSPVATERGLDRRLDALDIDLASLASAGHAIGGTVNDAFLAAVVGGLQRYHVHHGHPADQLRVTMPINTRREGDGAGGNKFSPARFAVPADIVDPAERMRAIGELTRGWRHEPAIGLTDALAGVLSHLPGEVTTSIFGSMLKGVDFVATNVPGTRERSWLAGAEVLRLYGYAPPSGAGVSFALLSHLDSACIGINVDCSAIPDGDLLTECLAEGFAEVEAVGRNGTTVRLAPPPADPPSDATTRSARVVKAPARLSALDASFLGLEGPDTPMHVGALLLFEGGPLLDEHGHVRLDAIRAELGGRIHRCPRMHQRVVPVPFGFGRPVWVEDEHFDIAHHVKAVHLDAPGTRDQLAELCCRLQMEVLDRSRPLWEMCLVDGLDDGSVALVYKVHHAIVDGVSAAETFELLLDPEEPHGPVLGTEPGQPTGARLVAEAAGDGLELVSRLTRGALDALIHPSRARATVKGLRELVTPTALAPTSSLNATIGARRVLASVAFPVDEIKALGRRHGATLNDVVLALVAGGLGTLMASRGESAHFGLQALVPVSLRLPDEHGTLGNRVTALLVRLPVGERDPVVRLQRVVQTTRQLKAGGSAIGMGTVLGWIDALPVPVVGRLSSLVHRQPFVNLVVTNVKGSETPLSLLGSTITEIIPVVPLARNLSVGIAVFSYNGRLVIGLHADPDVFGDLDVLVSGIEQAASDLRNVHPASPDVVAVAHAG